MPSAVARGPVTTRLVTELETAGFPVGDNSSPRSSYGWSGEPNAADSSFTPWMILTPGTAQPQRIPGALADTGTEWTLAYSVFYAGITRKQEEALADKMRLALTNITREVVVSPQGDWKIMKISCSGIGSSTRVGSAYPDYYTQIDNFEVLVSKEQ